MQKKISLLVFIKHLFLNRGQLLPNSICDSISPSVPFPHSLKYIYCEYA